MKIIFFAAGLLLSINILAQECKNCGKRTGISFYKIEWLKIQKPEDPVMLEQWQKLEILWSEISYQFDLYFKNNKCLFIRQVGQGTQNDDLSSDIFQYSIYGIIIQSASDYSLKLWMQPACSNKIMAETEVRFQLYPVLDADRITQQIVAQFAPLIKIPEFEIQQRNEKNQPFGGDLDGGTIEVQILNRDIGIGQQTGILLLMKDCDGKLLPDHEISFSKTKGGTVLPATVKTDAEGKAMAKFKLSASLKGEAIIIAESAPINAKGCKDLYSGEAIMLAPPAYNISVHYVKKGMRNIKWVGADSIFAITLADESEGYFVKAGISFYHYSPSTGKKTSNIQIWPDQYMNSESVIINIEGFSSLYKVTNSPEIEVVPLNARHKIAADTTENISSTLLLPPWVAMEYRNDTLYNFDINFDFPDNENGSPPASGALRCERGDKDATFKTRKINDPKSPYKMENIIMFIRETSEKNEIGNSTEYEVGYVRILSK